MASLNKVQIIGNLGRDPEIRNTNDNRKVANLAIATSKVWKDKTTGEKKEKTEWHRVAIFNENLVAVAEKFLKKGSKVFIEGELQTRKWQDQSGQDKYSTEIVLQSYNSELILLDKKEVTNESESEFAQSAKHYEQKSNGYQQQPDLDDEMPF